MTVTTRFRWGAFALALVACAFAGGAGDAGAAVAANGSAMHGRAADSGAVGLSVPPWNGEVSVSSSLLSAAEDRIDRGGDEVQVAGPVRRTSRRTARRTSRRQDYIRD